MMMIKFFYYVMFIFLSVNTFAQEKAVVDSIDTETGIIYPANDTEIIDSVCSDSTLGCPIPQVPFFECDSLMMRSLTDRYGVVWKDGKCGIYDLSRCENVTKIEYSNLWYAYRRELEGEYFTYFSWEESETLGIIGVAEANNQFISISMPKQEK